MADAQALQNEINRLSDGSRKWPENVAEITRVAVLIGRNITNAIERDSLCQSLCKATGAPKTTLGQAIKDEVQHQKAIRKKEAKQRDELAKAEELRRAKDNKERTRPEGVHEANERPIDLQAAELLFKENGCLIGERSWSLFKYASDKGFWEIWSDTRVMNSAQSLLKRVGEYSENSGWSFPYGSASQIKKTVEQLKVLTTDGPLSSSEPPPVIVFRNGTFDLNANKLDSHDPAHGATYGVAADYISGSDCPDELRKVVETCYPEGALPIVRVMIRWSVDPTIRYGETFHIIGETGTGKGLLIDFIRSLFPPSVIGQLLHPADLSSPEKLHQYVVGRRLVAFPDTPATYDGSCNIFYELVENKPATTRKLFAGASEESRPLHCRFILGSVKPLQFKDGRDGYLRRVITLHTLPRDGEPDTTLRDQLNPDDPRFDAIRAEAISWALAMPLDEVNEVLNRNDPEGLLRDAAQQAAVSSDTVSQWADACLVPDKDPNRPLTDGDRATMFECYLGWCEYNNVRYTSQRTNFLGQLRAILGPQRCLPRTKETIAQAQAAGRPPSERRNLPAIDAGFTLRPELMSQGTGALSQGTRLDFNPRYLGSGGLEKIAELPRATRPSGVSGPVSGPVSGRPMGSEALCRKGSDALPESVSGHFPQSTYEGNKHFENTAGDTCFFSFHADSRGGMESALRRPETATMPPRAEWSVGSPVELIQPGGGWLNGWRVAKVEQTGVGVRVRIESGSDFRIVDPGQIRPCKG